VKPIKNTGLKTDIESQKRMVVQHGRVLAGNVSFGTSTIDTARNIAGEWHTGTTPGTPNTQFSIAHGLGYVPNGYDVKRLGGAGYIYDGATPWTKTTVYLECSGASLTYSIFLH
jgi:hypothetical protein